MDLDIINNKEQRQDGGGMDMLSEAIREELVNGLLEIFQEEISMIILYGSVARGTETGESDIDIAIIIKHDMDNKKRISLSLGRQIWIFAMTRSFLLLIFRKIKWRSGDISSLSTEMSGRKEWFFGKQPERKSFG